MDHYLGIDFGTSGARAIVIQADGSIAAQTHCRFEASSDWVTIWRRTLFHLIQSLPEAIRASVRAIAINGTSSTVLLCNEAGDSIADPLLYNDDHGQSEITLLRQWLSQAQDGMASGRDTVLSPTSSLVKLLWWSRQPIFAQARYLLHQADWLAFLLHGQLGLSDYHNSLKLGYNVAQLTYPDWLRAMPIFPLLPTVLAPGTPIGPLKPEIAAQLGLPQGCQVCAGTTDSIAAFLASGATVPGTAVTSLGSTLVLKLLSQTPVESGQHGIYSHRLSDLWLVGGASNTGGAVLQAFFSATELAQLSGQISPERESPLHYYPLLKPGERFPVSDPDRLPCLTPRPENPAEFLHGLLESMARIEATGYSLLQSLGATPLSQVYTAGGGATNATWTAIRTRRLGLPVLRSTQTEAAYGTALLAQRGVNPGKLSHL